MGRRRVVALAVACVIGSAFAIQGSAPAVELRQGTMPGTADVVQSPSNKGFWTVDVGGDVEARDGALNYGTLRNHQLSHPIVGMSPTKSGKGYWLAGTDGGVFAFGDARFFGSTGGTRLNQPVVGIAATPTGNGYWLAASDGGVFSFGDARFYGSTGGLHLNQPIMGIASTPSGLGYWLVGADGGIFAFGDAEFRGSTAGIRLNQPVVDMMNTPTAHGYWLLANDGGLFAFGDAQFHGSTAGTNLGHATALASESSAGYLIALQTGAVAVFGDASEAGGARSGPPITRPGTTPTTKPNRPTTPTTKPPVTTPPATNPPATTPTTKPPVTTPTTKPPVTTPSTRPPVTPPPTSGPSSADEALGFYPLNPNSGGLERFAQHEQFLGRNIGYFTAFGDGNSMRAFSQNLDGQLQNDRLGQWAARRQTPPFRLVYMTPLSFGQGYSGNQTNAALIKEQWDALINNTTVRSSHPAAPGFNRQFYRDFARKLVAAGYGNAIIRLASEHDIPSSRWASEIDYEKFKGAFRAAVDAMRSVAPNLQIDFNSIRLTFGKGPGTGSRILSAYPGDSWVDYIGVNVYDQGPARDPIGVPDGRTCGWRDPQAVFDTIHKPYLDTAKAFAIAHGKRISLPEWGLSGGGYKAVGECGGDNPVFVANIHNWLSAVPAANLGYASYFEGNPGHDGPHELDAFPVAKNTFKAYFGN